jgi:hypothetical protein
MKKRLLTIVLTTITAISFAQSPQLEWTKSMGGSTNNDEGKAITVDADGNVYTTGFFNDMCDFDPSSGTFNLSSVGGYDVFIQKLDANGDFVWAKSFGGTSNEIVNSIAVDDSGNVYTVGKYSGTIDADPGAGITYLTSNGGSDYFIQKLDANGDFVWAKSIGGTGAEDANAISLDVNGNIYIAGQYGGTVDFDPGAGTFNLTASGFYEIYIQKLDADGNFIFAKSMGENSTQVGSMVVDKGNVYIAGLFYGTGDFDPGAGTFDLTSNGSSDDFIQKLDTNGNFVWAKSFGGTSTDEITSLAVDANENIYTTGFYIGTANFDPGTGTFDLTSNGSGDIFVQKLDVNGDFVWAKSMGGTAGDRGNSITIDAEGGLYITGYFTGTSDFHTGAGTFELTSNGSYDIYIAKLDSSGDLIWAGAMGGTSADAGASIVTDVNGSIYTTGFYINTVDFDPGVGVFNMTSTGVRDVFVQKLKLCVSSTGTDTRTECSPFVWIDGNTYTANNTTAQDTIFGGSSTGCDSIVTLNLTITTVDTSVTQTGTDLTANEMVATYQWLDCDNNYAEIPGATFRTYYVLANGTYAVEVTSFGCVDTSSCYNVIVTGVAENVINNNITIYPNPVKNQLTITVENEKIKSIEIINVAGKVIMKENNPTKTINVSNLSKGLYFIQVQTEKGVGVKRFIKE